MANNVKVERDDKAWEIEIKGEISADSLSKYREVALKELQKTAKLDGFRPGKAPIERLVSIYGETAIMRQAAQLAIEAELPELLAKENVLIVQAPRVQTDTPEAGRPLPFTARAPLPPEVKLPDWKAIAKKHSEKREPISVSDKEHEDAKTHLRRERARIDKMQAGEDPQKAAESSKQMEEKDLPALDDEFVKSIGYESVDAFEAALRTNMQNEKETQAKQLLRNAILDEIMNESTVLYPSLMKEYELDDMEGRIREDLSRFGSTFEKYLEQIKKTREEVRKEWDEAADKRAKTRLILSEIAKQEKVTPDQARVEAELKHAREHYKDVSEENLRAGISHAMRNEEVLSLLESQ
jgi:trigger factor